MTVHVRAQIKSVDLQDRIVLRQRSEKKSVSSIEGPNEHYGLRNP